MKLHMMLSLVLESKSERKRLTRPPWLKEGLFCSAEPQDPELLRSSIAVSREKKEKKNSAKLLGARTIRSASRSKGDKGIIKIKTKNKAGWTKGGIKPEGHNYD